MNLCFEKEIFVRFTIDAWKTAHDVRAFFLPGGDTAADRFVATIPCIASSHAVTNMAAVICYRVKEQEHWDSNYGRNYHFEITPMAPPLTPPRSPGRPKPVLHHFESAPLSNHPRR